MKYYIIAGEASGDLHGANLIKALTKKDTNAEILAWGGNLMEDVGANLRKHYRDLAFMGFVEVLLNLRTILKNINFCKADIIDFQPDALILIDYPGFNLRIAKWAKKQGIRVFYYISPLIEAEAEELAIKTIEAFDICGLLAVEMFLTKDNQLLINEVAPRPHNSGHHTIDSFYTSQFQQHLRGVLNLPLGSVKMKSPSVMINLLGEDGYSGEVKYQGLDEALKIEGVNVHLYGKKTTKPFRKMGHVTIVADDLNTAKKRAKEVQKVLKVVS